MHYLTVKCIQELNTDLNVNWKMVSKTILAMIDNESAVSHHAIRGVTLALEMEMRVSGERELESSWDAAILELKEPNHMVVRGTDFVGHEARRQRDGFEMVLKNKKLQDKLKEFVND